MSKVRLAKVLVRIIYELYITTQVRETLSKAVVIFAQDIQLSKDLYAHPSTFYRLQHRYYG